MYGQHIKMWKSMCGNRLLIYIYICSLSRIISHEHRPRSSERKKKAEAWTRAEYQDPNFRPIATETFRRMFRLSSTEMTTITRSL